LSAHRLSIAGGFAVCADDRAPQDQAAQDRLPRGTRSLILIAPAEPGFWAHLTAQPEWQDGRADPVDRWSRRVIGRIACTLGGKALFPFGGPPFHPFFRWALRSGQAWQSPVQLLVHETAGLWACYRGALALKQVLELGPPSDASAGDASAGDASAGGPLVGGAMSGIAPPNSLPPCRRCHSRPCLTACPAAALNGAEYDLPRCHRYLDTPQGRDCASQGCAVRRACPISQSHGRMAEQSAYHMSQFHR
jgi:epoxyqueuosine reductase